MSLRAVMHYLFERAGFNRWTPAMEGKRTQAVLHRYLLEAARGIETKGVQLSDRLYVPEPFREERKVLTSAPLRRWMCALVSSAAALRCHGDHQHTYGTFMSGDVLRIR